MVAGVYAAATTRQVDVNGTVSFTAQDVAATVHVYEYFSSNYETALPNSAAIATRKTAENGIQFTLGSAAGQQKDDASTGLVKLGDEGDIALSDSVLVYAYKIVVRNDFAAGSAVKATFTWNSGNAETGNGITITPPEEMVRTTTAETGNSVEFIVTVAVNAANAPQAIANLVISSKVVLERA